MPHKRKNRDSRRLKHMLFPSFAPLPMKIMAVLAILVLLSAGILFAVGYFDGAAGSVEDAAESSVPSPVVDSDIQTAEPVSDRQDAPITADNESPEPTDEQIIEDEVEAVELHLETDDGTTYFDDDNLIIYVGSSLEIGVFVNGEAASDAEITWKSFDEAVLTAENGVLTAVSAGKTKLRATYSGSNQSISLNVTVVSSSVTAAPAGAVSPAATAKPTSTPEAPSEIPTEIPGNEPSIPPTETTPELISPVEPGDRVGDDAPVTVPPVAEQEQIAPTEPVE